MSCRKYTYIKPIGLDHDGLVLRLICWDVVRCDGCRLQVGGLGSLFYRSESFVSKSQIAVKRKGHNSLLPKMKICAILCRASL